MLSVFQVVLGGACVVYEVGRGRESMAGSLSVSSMEQVVGMLCLGSRVGEMGDGGSILSMVLHLEEYCVGQKLG